MLRGVIEECERSVEGTDGGSGESVRSYLT